MSAATDFDVIVVGVGHNGLAQRPVPLRVRQEALDEIHRAFVRRDDRQIDELDAVPARSKLRAWTSPRSICSPARGTRSPVHVARVTPNSRDAAQPASFRLR